MYRWVDHTAELELDLSARSEEALFAEALAASAELVGDEDDGEPARYEVTATAADRAALLAAWLEELVFLAETEEFVPERVAEIELAHGTLRAAVEGRRATPRHLVKSVTYHGLELRRDATEWVARVVLDV